MYITLLLVFGAVLLLAIAGYMFLNRRRLAAADAARTRLQGTREIQAAEAPSILRDEKLSTLPALDRMLSGRLIVDVVARQQRRSGSTSTPGAFFLHSAVAAVGTFILARLMGAGAFSIFALPFGAVLPYLWLKRKERKRLNKFQEQLPDAIDMLVSAMRAGYSFQAAMKFIGDETVAPLGPEFSRFYDEQRLGMEVRQALLALQERVPSLDLKMLVTAIIIQRETGGNLSEVLSNISEIMRQRAAMRGEIETLTAESKLSARILSAMPVIMFFAISLIRPAYTSILTSTGTGRIMLLVAAVIVATGYTTMMKIANVDI